VGTWAVVSHRIRFPNWLLPNWLLPMLLLAGSASAGPVIDIGGRSVEVHVPAGYHAGARAPVVMLLHGYGASGAIQEAYFQLGELADEFGFLLVHPDGTENTVGNRFWNATDACCDLFGSGVDDAAYLRAVLDAMRETLSIDPRRVFVVGHSNGGFMAYRMACDHADLVAAVVSLAGATYDDPGDCTPSEPVHALQIHGTLDDTILYAGGLITGTPYPGAIETAETFATYAGCALVGDPSPPPLDLDASLPGAETTVTRYASGCAAGGSAELWTLVDGEHIPTLSADFHREVIEYLFAHGKPVPPVPALSRRGLGLLALGVLLAASRPRRRVRA